MSEAQANPPVAKPVTKDKGFRGRKIIAGLSTAGSIFATATVGWLVMDKMSAAEWADAMLWVVVPTSLITLGLISAEKLMAFLTSRKVGG